MRSPFLCDGCGLCCCNVGHIEELNSVNGICINYDKTTKKCTIYDNRPLVCRVDALFDEIKPSMTWEELCYENYQACEKLKSLTKIESIPILEEK